MINRNRKLDKTRVILQDIEDIKNEIRLEALLKKSPKFDINKAVKVNNTYFMPRKGETKEQTITRVTNAFKYSIL